MKPSTAVSTISWGSTITTGVVSCGEQPAITNSIPSSKAAGNRVVIRLSPVSPLGFAVSVGRRPPCQYLCLSPVYRVLRYLLTESKGKWFHEAEPRLTALISALWMGIWPAWIVGFTR